MRRQIQTALLGAVFAGWSMGTALAEVSAADRSFVEQAAMSGHAEVASGEAAAKSENPAVAAFGKQMVTDHTEMNDELNLIATGKGIAPPESASLMQQAKGAAISVLPGTTFDKTYVDQQLSDHQKSLALLQNQASSGTDPELKAFAQNYIPVVEQHIAELEKLKQQPELQ